MLTNETKQHFEDLKSEMEKKAMEICKEEGISGEEFGKLAEEMEAKTKELKQNLDASGFLNK